MQYLCLGKRTAPMRLMLWSVGGAIAVLVQVTVRYPSGRQPLVTYRQPFTGPTTRLCLNCFKVRPFLPGSGVVVKVQWEQTNRRCQQLQ